MVKEKTSTALRPSAGTATVSSWIASRARSSFSVGVSPGRSANSPNSSMVATRLSRAISRCSIRRSRSAAERLTVERARSSGICWLSTRMVAELS